MKEEGRANPSQYIAQRGDNKNLCISGDGVKQVSNECWWGIAISERGKTWEMRA